MKPSDAIKLYRREICAIVARNHAKNVRVFGSVITGEDTEKSDLDLLVDITNKTILFDIAKIQSQLQKLLHISVDVLTPKALPEQFRCEVLKQAIPL